MTFSSTENIQSIPTEYYTAQNRQCSKPISNQNPNLYIYFVIGIHQKNTHLKVLFLRGGSTLYGAKLERNGETSRIFTW